MKGSGTFCSTFLRLLCFPPASPTHPCLTRAPRRSRAWPESVWTVSLTAGEGGRVIDMCRRTRDKQPTLNGITPACLIPSDWAKTELRLGMGGQWGGEGFKARRKWQKGSCFHLPLQTKWMHVNDELMDVLSFGGRQMNEEWYPVIDCNLWGHQPPLLPSWGLFCFLEHCCYFALTFLLAWRVGHGQPPNGLQIHIETESLVSPLSVALSETQNKRWRQHTAPLMAALGSATKVSLNCLMHHFGFVHHDRELCVRREVFIHHVLLSPNGCTIGLPLISGVHYATYTMDIF